MVSPSITEDSEQLPWLPSLNPLSGLGGQGDLNATPLPASARIISNTRVEGAPDVPTGYLAAKARVTSATALTATASKSLPCAARIKSNTAVRGNALSALPAAARIHSNTRVEGASTVAREYAPVAARIKSSTRVTVSPEHYATFSIPLVNAASEGSNVEWENPEDALSDDTDYASAGGFGTSDRLVATDDAGAHVPDGTLTELKFNVRRYAA